MFFKTSKGHLLNLQVSEVTNSKTHTFLQI